MLNGVSDMYVITDDTQTIEIYATDGDTHTNEYTLVYLPRARILVEADAYNPGPPDAPPPANPPPNAVKLFEEIERLKALQQVNPLVRDEEIEALEQRLREGDHLLQQAKLRLDAIRVLVAG